MKEAIIEDGTMINLDIIKKNNTVKRELIKKVLIIFFPLDAYIGDYCKFFNGLSLLKAYYKNSKIDIVFEHKYCDEILTNNPSISKKYVKNWRGMHLAEYDVLLSVLNNEQELLDFINYVVKNIKSIDKLSIFTLSRSLFISFDANNIIFENLYENKEFIDFLGQNISLIQQCTGGELYLTDDELLLIENWYTNKLVKSNENIIILLDYTDKKKLMNTLSYMNFLERIQIFNNIKILIYDEKGIGKKEFYEGVVSQKYFSRFIFAEKTGLRHSIGLLADKRVKIIFGVDTGLMHCASGIYNIFLKNKTIDRINLPIFMTYLGKTERQNPYFWYYGSLVDCVKIIINDNGESEIRSIFEDAENFNRNEYFNNLLPIESYTGNDLFEFIYKKYYKKLLHFNMITRLCRHSKKDVI